jgi:glutathione S-transferase
MRILGRTSSINVRKVLWTALESGVAYKHEDEWAGAASTRSDAFLRLNPNGLVPVLEDEGLVLWESNTISRYLAGKYGPPDLLPSDPADRARVEMWMDWQATELNPAWSYAFLALVRRHPERTDPEQVAASAAAWNRAMQVLDGQLDGAATYIAGDRFTVADIVLALSIHRWRSTPIDKPRLSAVDAYMWRLAERDGFRRFATPEMP